MPLICCLPFSWQQFLTLLTDHCTRRTAENWEQYTRTIYTIIIQQWPFMQASPGKLAAELSETLTHCTTFTVLKLLTRTPNLPSSGSYSTSSYNTRRNSRDTVEEPEDKNLHFQHTRLILYLTMSLVNHWCPLNHALSLAGISWG